MAKYAAFYRGRRITVEAPTSYAAQKQAAITLKAKRSYDVAIVLADDDGQPREEVIRAL